MPTENGAATRAERPWPVDSVVVPQKATGAVTDLPQLVVCWECLDRWLTQRFLAAIGFARNRQLPGQNPIYKGSDLLAESKWFELHQGHRVERLE